jgi:hypothetical protein
MDTLDDLEARLKKRHDNERAAFRPRHWLSHRFIARFFRLCA